MSQINEFFTGNLCRCTGYRPILDGYRSFTNDQTCGKRNCCRLKKADSDTEIMANGCIDTASSNGATENRSSEEFLIDQDLYNINHFSPYDPSQDVIFPPELKVLHHELHTQSLEYKGPRVTYYRPTSLSHLLNLKSLYPDAKLVVGNTELGVEVKFKNQLYPVLISPTHIKELTSVVVSQSGIVVGSSVTLSTLEEKLRDLIESQPEYKTRIFSAIVEMLRWFAGKQIRNVGAIGGNIMTGSPISDLNPLLMAAGAKLSLCSQERGYREVEMDEHFFTGYRKNIVLADEILVSVHIPYTREDEYFLGFKQARRRDDDIAIVNAGMKVSFRSNDAVVNSLRMAFGGMAPTTVMATKTMRELAGKHWNSSLLETGTSLLLQDLPLSPSAPGGMIEYRRALTVSFFFKFYLSVREQHSVKFPELIAPLSAEEQGVVQIYHHPPPKSCQLFQKISSSQDPIDPIGRPMCHSSALKQATGEALYVDDMPHFSKELYAGLVLSTRAHARIISIDESEALRLEGVERFFCSKDLPGSRNETGAIVHDEEVFASKIVTCVGQLIGLIVAKDQSIAQRAAKLVRIKYEDIQPLVITIQEAIVEKAYLNQWTIKKGETESAFKAADHVLEGDMHMGGQEHFYLETNAHLAVPKGEDGEMEIFSSCQNPTETQKLVAKALGVPENRVVCHVKRMGGGFGGKETRTSSISIPLCVAASALNRPVRIMLDRDEDMVMTGTRHPFYARWKVGFSSKGLLSAIEMDLYANSGCSLDLSAAVIQRAMFSMDNAYKCDNTRVTGYACKTNLASNTAFRGFGGPQGMLFAEDVMTRIAAFLKIDPNMVREKNLYASGDKTHYNQLLERCTIRRCWDEVLQQADYDTRKGTVEKFNREHKYRKRGLSVIPVKFGISFTAHFLNQAGALVLVYTDGSVLLSHGGTEMGQGLHTKMIQVAARTLKISADQIHISETATDKVPNTSPTAASASSDLNGMAVLNACEKILRRLKPYISKDPDGSWENWVKAAYFDRVSLSATGFYRTPGISDFDFGRNEGTPFNYFSYGAAVTEVEIDCLTGDHSVLRSDIMMDVGESLNPAIDIGQIEGAFMQGLGLFTLEELRYSPTGVLLTRGPGAYKIPGFQDIPSEFNVSLLRGAPNPRAVFSSKAVGEPPLFLAASVFFGIRQAVEAARASYALNPCFRFDSPATAERIRMSCQDFITAKIEPAELGDQKPWSVTV
ncbi:hypothetical protein SK128_008316 [Halocaridina rubra]|uniref:FAD-binding PCMH-type domain-containing protein n=1 Tax=Halocaridina rubra TaxID=373956 RepID=A0AAN9AFA6_HALRR